MVVYSVTCAVFLFIITAVIEGAPTNTTGSGEQDIEVKYCSGYRPGNPARASDIENCKAGNKIGVVDHTYAFGLNPMVRSPNWTACGIPALPGENERVCYKTTVLQCEDGYRVYLNKRNLEKLQSNCANETDAVPTSPSGDRILQSPRYGCRKPHYDKFFPYRRNEFCLYDISVPNCPSGRVIVHNNEHYTQELEQRQRYRICSDYLQLFTESTAYSRYCESELSRINLEIPATHFTALFWTDTSVNELGFRLSVSCVTDQNSDV